MIFVVNLIIDNDILLNLFEIDVPVDETENVKEAIDCEMWFNDFDTLDI